MDDRIKNKDQLDQAVRRLEQAAAPHIKRMFTETIFYGRSRRRFRKISKRAESCSPDRTRHERERSDTGEAGTHAGDAVPPMSPSRHGKDPVKPLPTSRITKGKEPFRSPPMSPSGKGKGPAR